MRRPSDETVVVFTVSEAILRGRMAIRTGPCVSLGETEAALCSPLRQDGGEEPRHTAALYEVLTGQPASTALEPVEDDPPGHLLVCSHPFLDAMAQANQDLQRLADADDAAGDDELPRFTQGLDALDSAWLKAAPWPKHYVSTRNRIAPRLAHASDALESGDPLWCWYGPRVPEFVVHAGQGPHGDRRR